jgi:acyl carrier protein
MNELLKTIMIEDLHLDPSAVSPGASREDAGMDSLSMVDLSVALSRRYGVDISDAELLELKTVADIAALIEQRAPKA